MSLQNGNQHAGCYSGALIKLFIYSAGGGLPTQAAERLICCNVTVNTATADSQHLPLPSPQRTEVSQLQTPGAAGPRVRA